MGEWMVQVPVKLEPQTVAQIDAEVHRFPMCAGRSAYARFALESWFKLLEEGIVNPLPEGFEINTGIYGQRIVADLLRSSGRCVKPQVHNAPFDLLVDGWKVEVKCAKPYKYCRQLTWKTKSSKSHAADFYIVRMENYYDSMPEHLLLPGPITVASMRFSRNTVSTKYRGAIKAFEEFRTGAYGRAA